MAHQDIQGVIEKIHTKSGQGKRGPWTKYSAIINGGWVSFGFDNPGFEEGDEVKVRCEETQYGLDVKQSKLINKKANVSKTSSGAKTANYNEGMLWGNANNVAASVLTSLTAMDALPITAATGKANKAKRYEEIMEIFDKLRVEFFKDGQDIDRVLSRVADAGEVEDNVPPPLPNGDVEVEAPEDVEDEEDF